MLPVKAINALMGADLLLAAPRIRKEIAEFVPASCRTAENLQEALQILPALPAEVSFQLVRIFSEDAVNTELPLNEAKFFENAGFETEIIPAVSQIQAIPASSGFPLTRRNGGQSFWVADVGSATSPVRLRRELQSTAASTATLVLLHAGAYKQELLAIIRGERGEDMTILEQDELILVARGRTPPLSRKTRTWNVMTDDVFNLR